MKKVLVLEDEASIRSFIVINLQRAGYEVVEAECGEEALQKLQDNPDTRVCLLDIMLPDIDGFEVCRRIRMSNAQIGIIMLTARAQEMDKVTGLMTGADDYVTKPFSFREMVSRVRAQLRRTQWEKDDPTVRRYGKLTIFLNEHRAAADGKTLNLSPKEYDILCKLMEKPNWVVTREQLLSSIWGDEYEGEMRTVDMHMTNLRRKLDEAGAKDYIQTVRAVGYKMKPLEEKAE